MLDRYLVARGRALDLATGAPIRWHVRRSSARSVSTALQRARIVVADRSRCARTLSCRSVGASVARHRRRRRALRPRGAARRTGRCSRRTAARHRSRGGVGAGLGALGSRSRARGTSRRLRPDRRRSARRHPGAIELAMAQLASRSIARPVHLGRTAVARGDHCALSPGDARCATSRDRSRRGQRAPLRRPADRGDQPRSTKRRRRPTTNRRASGSRRLRRDRSTLPRRWPLEPPHCSRRDASPKPRRALDGAFCCHRPARHGSSVGDARALSHPSTAARSKRARRSRRYPNNEAETLRR